MPIEMAEAFPFPGELGAEEVKPEGKAQAVPLAKDSDFEPFWYGNAKFPEDDNL